MGRFLGCGFFLGGLGWFLGDGVEVDVVQGSVFGEAFCLPLFVGVVLHHNRPLSAVLRCCATRPLRPSKPEQDGCIGFRMFSIFKIYDRYI